MAILSGIKTVKEVMLADEVIIYDNPGGGRTDQVELDSNRKYIVPAYQREIKWSTENVQVLIDDLIKGKKFLGTITFSTSKQKEYEIIDGQQRLTVISLILTYLNNEVEDSKKVKNLCKLDNKSFGFFDDALRYQFDYKIIEIENKELFNKIIRADILNQKDEFVRIWNGIVERLAPLSRQDKEAFLSALCESELNVIVNKITPTDTQIKFCVDYFIDINNKSVILESLDIIRAYAFKENFADMTQKWVDIQTKCKKIEEKANYPMETLFYHYFICNVNKEIDYTISKLTNDYRIKEDIKVNGRKYASGTFIWNTFNDSKFYYNMLNDLNSFLDFIEIVISSETGGNDKFKSFFTDQSGKRQSEATILNAHNIINTILRNDDIVPKMMVMKYYFEVLLPNSTQKAMYKYIYDIGIIATVFTLSQKRKGTELIAGKIMQQKWFDLIRDYACSSFSDIPNKIDFEKVVRERNEWNEDTGLRAARRIIYLVDSCSSTDGKIKFNEDKYMKACQANNIFNMEHFIINRNGTYALYLSDNTTVDISITLPKRTKRYMATLANYIILESDTNKELKNRPVYEKIDILEGVITEKGIDAIMPSIESQRRYEIIKRIMYEGSNYPYQKIKEEKLKTKRKELLNNYYRKDFISEYQAVIRALRMKEQ